MHRHSFEKVRLIYATNPLFSQTMDRVTGKRAPGSAMAQFLNRAAGRILLKQMGLTLKQAAPLVIIGRLRELRPKICDIF